MLERFEAHLMPVPFSGCWLWDGPIVLKGYGCFSFKQKRRFAHRVSWELYKGSIPSGMLICHRCDIPSCVNPEHLFPGTYSDNINDMYAKGRGRPWNSMKTHCHKGHEFSVENTRFNSKGGRLCIKCDNEYHKIWERAKRRANGIGPYLPKSFCKNGHEFNSSNTMIRSDGGRRCRICTEKIQRLYKIKMREKRSLQCP